MPSGSLIESPLRGELRLEPLFLHGGAEAEQLEVFQGVLQEIDFEAGFVGGLACLYPLGEEGAPVTLRHEAAWGPSQSRQGRLQRLVGELDANARLARVLVSVEDPLALRAEARTPSLILGAFVRTAIEGRALDDVVRLDRSLLRREDTVWVMEDGALDIRDVTVLLRDDDYVYLSEGLDQGDQVVATDLATVVDGAALRLEDAAGAETME